MDTKDKIAVMQAFVDEKKIERKTKGYEAWHEIDMPVWNWATHDYRVKVDPEVVYIVDEVVDGVPIKRFVSKYKINNPPYKNYGPFELK